MKKKEKETLESALKKLESIVERLSKGDGGLETSMEKFKEGIALVKFCKAELKRFEKSFSELKTGIEDGDAENEEV